MEEATGMERVKKVISVEIAKVLDTLLRHVLQSALNVRLQFVVRTLLNLMVNEPSSVHKPEINK